MQAITRQYKTETSHIVRNAFSDRCKFNEHGHRYTYEVSITGPVDPFTGMILDFKQLADIGKFIDNFDHCSIFWEKDEDEELKEVFIRKFNRVLIMKKNPTAENMVRLVCKFVSEWLENYHPTCKLHKVRIWETLEGSAEGDEFDSEDTFSFMSLELAGTLK